MQTASQHTQRPLKKINQIEPWLGEEEKWAVLEYLDSGGWLTEFKKTRQFEHMIAAYTSSKFASVVSNGTMSLVIALMALDIGEGDEVIVPDYTMIASINAVALAGARPVLVDIDPENLCLDINLARNAITTRTKGIIYVGINGRSHDMNEVAAFAHEHNLHLIEDAAQCLGSLSQGKHLGTFGEIGSFSFSHPKIITTGQGGALVTDSEETFSIISKIRDFGRTRSGVDYHETLGLNAKFTDIQAVIGIEQIKKLDWRVNRKKEIYKLYHQILQDTPGIEFVETNLEDTAPWFIDILVENRTELAEFLNGRGIGTRPFYPAVHSQPLYAHVEGIFPQSSEISRKGLWLPSSSFISDEDIEMICNEIKGFYSQYR